MRMPPWPRIVDAAAVVVIVAGMAVALVIDPRPRWLAWFSSTPLRYLVIEDKTGLYPFRLLSILALTWLAVRMIPFHSGWLRSRWAAPFVLVGQNSLPVFCSGIVFGFVARLGLEYDDRAQMQIGINLFGGVGMVLVGALAAWYRTKNRERTPRASAAVATAPLLSMDARPDTG
jgi:hypothetical protein